jgi:hypothetical protein
LTNDGKTSIRGGAGIYYAYPMTTQYNAFADKAPFAPQFSLCHVSFADPYGSAGLANSFPAQYGPNLPGPDVAFELLVSICRYFPTDFRISQIYTWNRVYPGFGQIGIYASENNSSYNSLQIGVEKRFGSNLSVIAIYSWSKTIDDYGRTDPFNRSFDHGISDDDIPQLFKLTPVYQIPTFKMSRFLSGLQTAGN